MDINVFYSTFTNVFFIFVTFFYVFDVFYSILNVFFTSMVKIISCHELHHLQRHFVCVLRMKREKSSIYRHSIRETRTKWRSRWRNAWIEMVSSAT